MERPLSSLCQGEISLSHRPKSSGAFPPLYACVARPVNKKEQSGNAKAKAALQKEWDKLTSQGCWDLSRLSKNGMMLRLGHERKGRRSMLVGFSTSASRRIMSCQKTIRTASIKGESSSRDVSSVMRSGTGPCSQKTPPAPPCSRVTSRESSGSE